jgi:peptidoglycan-associated lipoprotein
MIQTHRGRGGLMARSWLKPVGLSVVLVAVLAIGGCSSKKNEAGAGGAGGAGANGGLGQEGMGGSSLQQLQKGSLGSEGEGPLSDIHFAYNESTVQPQDSDILKANADWLQKNPTAHVQIEGHCDDRGSAEYNLGLGAKRAQSAKDYLQTLGIAANRISTISYGKELPSCTEETDDCWAKNRRDHFVVTQ